MSSPTDLLMRVPDTGAPSFVTMEELRSAVSKALLWIITTLVTAIASGALALVLTVNELKESVTLLEERSRTHELYGHADSQKMFQSISLKLARIEGQLGLSRKEDDGK